MDADQEVQTDEEEQEMICAACQDSVKNNDLKLCNCNYKIHHECLKMMVLSWRSSTLDDVMGIQCLRCSSIIKLQLLPTKGVLVNGMEAIVVRYKWLCRKLLNCVTFVVIQQALTTHGLAVLCQIHGKEKAYEITNSMHPITAVFLCQAIPLLTIAISSVQWEYKLLRVLRRCSRLPLLGRVFPREYPDVREPPPSRHLVSTVLDGLLMPWYGGLCGLLVCGSSTSGLRRLLLGTLTFLAVRGGLYMYCRQRRHSYVGNRCVANYREGD